MSSAPSKLDLLRMWWEETLLLKCWYIWDHLFYYSVNTHINLQVLKHYGRLLLLLVLPAINIKNMRTLNTYIIATIYTYIAVHLSKKTILIPIFLVNQNRTFRLVWNFISFCELWYMKFCYNYFKQKHRKKNAKMNEK